MVPAVRLPRINRLPILPRSTDSMHETAMREHRGVNVQVAAAGDLGAGDADVAPGNQRQEIARHQRFARILGIDDVAFDLDIAWVSRR